MKTEDGSEGLHPWIEPELEARLTALVLGEASDFERDELERLVAERPELGLYCKRLEAMHRMLREVAKGESAEEQGEWKLGADRRERLLAQLSGSIPAPEPKSVAVTKRSPWSISSRFLAVAATIVFVGLMLGLMFPASTGALRSKGGKSQWYDDAYANETYVHDRERMMRALDEGWESPVPVESSSGIEGESRHLALADQATRRPAPTSAPPTPPAEPMVVTRSGQIAASTGTAAIGAGGEIALGIDPDSPNRIAVTTSGTRSTMVSEAERHLGRQKSETFPASGPAVAGEPVSEQQVTRLGAGTLALNGGVVEVDGFIDHKQKADALESAPDGRMNPNFTGDMEANGIDEINAKAEDDSRTFGSGGAVADAGKMEGSEGFGFEAPAKTDGRSRAAGVGGAAEQGADVSRMGRSVAVEKSLSQATESELKRESTGDWGKVPPSKAPIDESVALGGEISAGYMSDYIFYGTRMNVNEGDHDKADVPALATADADRTKDHVIRRELPSDFGQFDTTMTSRTLNFGAATSTIDSSSGFFEVTEGSSSMDPETAERLKKMRYFDGDEAESNHLATAESGFELPGLQSDKKTFRFSVRAGSHRTDAEVTIDEPWLFRRAGGVDQSVADIMALTPQVGTAMEPEQLLEQVVPRIVGGGSVPANPNQDALASADGTGLRGFAYRDVTAKESGDDMAVKLDYAAPLDDSKLTSEGRFQFTMGASFGDETEAKAEKSANRPTLRQPTPAALDETSPSAEPFSTFSLHVSDVSFQLAKAALASGKWPEAEKIRIEEFVNAFDYGDPIPAMEERVACRIDQGAHPFLQQRHLVRIALRTAEAGRSSGTPLRLTLLLDSSGSMERPDRRATLTRAVATLAGLLGENDRITLVSFARQPRLVADAVAGNEAMKLAETVAALPSEGGTNLEAALQLAFEKAREHQEPNAQNRIVLLTDGAANLGDAKAESLGQRVEMMREAGIAFDAAGFGAEGLNDEILEALTRKGDGRYYLLDRPEDAGDAFAEQIAGALRPAAKNVKVQVEFNPDRVKSYKLLGFEKHRLATEDFRNDAVDAAEMAASEAGVAVYQVEPDPAGEGDLGSVSVRFRDLDSGEMIERRWALPHLPSAPTAEQGGDAILLATVASQFAAKLAGGPLGDVVDLGELARLAAALPESERVKELRTMIEQARGLEGDR